VQKRQIVGGMVGGRSRREGDSRRHGCAEDNRRRGRIVKRQLAAERRDLVIDNPLTLIDLPATAPSPRRTKHAKMNCIPS
jgi:hypothetical protein